MAKTWIVAADSSRARIFSTDKPKGPLQEMADLAHPEARLHAQDLYTDSPGRPNDGNPSGRQSMESGSDPKEQESVLFAKRVCQSLSAGLQRGDFEKLYVVSAPTFLGHLRSAMNNSLKGKVVAEIDKNLAAHSVDEIRSHLPEYL